MGQGCCVQQTLKAHELGRYSASSKETVIDLQAMKQEMFDPHIDPHGINLVSSLYDFDAKPNIKQKPELGEGSDSDDNDLFSEETITKLVESSKPFPALPKIVKEILEEKKSDLKNFNRSFGEQKTYILSNGLRTHFFQGDEEAVESGAGYCQMLNKDGEYYQGMIINFSPWSGLLVFSSGDSILGQFLGRRAEGYVELSTTSGDRYIGMMKAGMKHGKGVIYYVDGSTYKGKFAKDYKCGKGIYSYSSGDEYRGHFKKNQKWGAGVYRWSNGQVYSGGWKEDKKWGKGRLEWPDGSVFIGSWENDIRKGGGIFVKPDGVEIKGKWENDEYVGELDEITKD